MISEEELQRPSNQTNFKVEVMGRCRCRYLYICTAMHRIRLKPCSVKYILSVVYIRLHIFISSLALHKCPKKYRFYKSFLISKAIM